MRPRRRAAPAELPSALLALATAHTLPDVVVLALWDDLQAQVRAGDKTLSFYLTRAEASGEARAQRDAVRQLTTRFFTPARLVTLIEGLVDAGQLTRAEANAAEENILMRTNKDGAWQ